MTTVDTKSLIQNLQQPKDVVFATSQIISLSLVIVFIISFIIMYG